MSDLYGLQNALSQSNSMTRDNMEYNTNIQTTKDGLYNDYMRQKGKDENDAKTSSDILEGKDAIASFGGVSGLPKYGKAFSNLGDGTMSGFWNAQRELSKTQNPLFEGLRSGIGKAGSKVGAVGVSAVKEAGTRIFTPEFKPEAVSGARAEAGRQVIASRLAPETPTAKRIGGTGSVYEPMAESIRPDVNVPTTPPPAPTTTPNKSGASAGESGGITEDISSKTPAPETSATETFFKKAGGVMDTAGKGMRLAGNIGGYIDDVDLIKSGFKAQGDGLHKASEWLNGIGSLVDTIGLAIPILEPIGEAMNLAGAITSTIDEVDHNQDKVNADKTNYDTQTNTANLKPKGTQNLTQMGLVATQNSHLGNLGAPISTF
jgi:hypothetical protein